MKINKCGCGGDTKSASGSIRLGHSVYCLVCGISTTWRNSLKEAIKAWNTAHPDIDELKSELETYKKALELMAKEIEDINPGEDINDYNLFICEVVSKYLTKAKEDK